MLTHTYYPTAKCTWATASGSSGKSDGRAPKEWVTNDAPTCKYANYNWGAVHSGAHRYLIVQKVQKPQTLVLQRAVGTCPLAHQFLPRHGSLVFFYRTPFFLPRYFSEETLFCRQIIHNGPCQNYLDLGVGAPTPLCGLPLTPPPPPTPMAPRNHTQH